MAPKTTYLKSERCACLCGGDERKKIDEVGLGFDSQATALTRSYRSLAMNQANFFQSPQIRRAWKFATECHFLFNLTSDAFFKCEL